jgi:hypothetical protein
MYRDGYSLAITNQILGVAIELVAEREQNGETVLWNVATPPSTSSRDVALPGTNISARQMIEKFLYFKDSRYQVGVRFG